MQLALQASLDDSQPATADSPEVHNIDDLGYPFWLLYYFILVSFSFSSVFLNLESDTNYYEDDEELQKALMISAAEPQATTTSTTSSHPISYPSAQPPTPSPTTHSSKPSATTHATSMPSTTSHIPSSRPQNTTPQRVYDVDGDVDMDISEDPELQEALMHSLDTVCSLCLLSHFSLLSLLFLSSLSALTFLTSLISPLLTSCSFHI